MQHALKNDEDPDVKKVLSDIRLLQGSSGN